MCPIITSSACAKGCCELPTHANPPKSTRAEQVPAIRGSGASKLPAISGLSSLGWPMLSRVAQTIHLTIPSVRGKDGRQK